MHSILQNVGWRNHNILENLDEQDSPKPDKFKKISSTSSLNTLRMSLRKRMPLNELKFNINAMPDWERIATKDRQHSLQSMTVTAKSMFGAMSQKIRKNRKSQNQYLLTSPEKVKTPKRPNQTPRSGTKCRTPRRSHCRLKHDAGPSARSTPNSRNFSPRSRSRDGSAQWRSFSSLVGEERLVLRRSSRAAALRSPYSSPATVGKRILFDKDLETISTGIRQLKRLSRVFDDAILKEESDSTVLLIDN
ncbi:hypothetical protein GDO86_003103 [Hymenochirus boettgeri]|uniref:PICALM-interacting mitotic regulator n=1 Tax=Hymenochirus boettgeri TaxID=247094 RepID=A0A8T2K5P1_9PIPI|nr:hypothetical protein GDO86_003103 [Hymenochirus boettgeri]